MDTNQAGQNAKSYQSQVIRIYERTQIFFIYFKE